VLVPKDDEGVTALMKAAEQGEGDVVKLLLEEATTIAELHAGAQGPRGP